MWLWYYWLLLQKEILAFKTNYFSTYLITETELVSNSDVILGGVNSGRKVDIKDSALVKRQLAGWKYCNRKAGNRV